MNVLINVLLKKLGNKLTQSPLTLSLLAINIVLMLIEIILSGSTDLSAEVVRKLGAIKGGDYDYHMLTYMFLHGSILHIFVNSFSLLMLGLNLEPRWGSFKFLTVYFLSGLAGGFAVAYGGTHLTVGASGAILGLMAADILDHVLYKAYKTSSGRSNLVAYAIDMSVIYYVSSLPNVSSLGHLGGILGGAFVSLFLFMLLKNNNMHSWVTNLKKTDEQKNSLKNFNDKLRSELAAKRNN